MPSLASSSLPRLLLLGSTLLASVGAVTIKLSNFGNGPLCSGPTVLECPAIADNDCCNAGQHFDEALFTGLPPTGIGITYSGTGCTGTVTDSGYGLSLCLSRGGQSANWQGVGRRQKRANKECNQVQPSVFHIGDRKFKVFGDVPPEVTQDMLDLFRNSSGKAEVPETPEHFLPHEIVE